MSKESCYMCNEEGSTNEHVPPKCLFPELKDLPLGLDLRKELISVPSCPKHNTHKSLDDEYLLYILVVSILSNNIALTQFATKIVRAIERNPNLVNLITKNKKRIILEDIKTGKVNYTYAFPTDRDRFDKTIIMLARALYFHVYKKKWLDDIYIHPDFLISLDPQEGRKDNEYFASLAEEEDRMFAAQPYLGLNPDVFKYQMLENSDFLLFRLIFYSGCKVLVSFGLREGISLPFLKNLNISGVKSQLGVRTGDGL